MHVNADTGRVDHDDVTIVSLRNSGKKPMQDTSFSRNTIRKYLRLNGVEPKFKVSERPSKLAPFCRSLSAWLKTVSKKGAHAKVHPEATS